VTRLPFGEPAAPPRTRPGRRVLTVPELTARIRLQLESAYPTVWVEGELSNCRRWNTGHLYFTLKGGTAQIRGVMFRSAFRYLRFEPADGQRVVARGRIGVYEPKGEYQLVAEHLEPFGLGARQLAFDQLRQRLENEGLFDEARKRPLPTLPRKIGIVTSLDGAALRDILNVLGRRFPNVHLVIGPTRVQGDGAGREIAGALSRLAGVAGIDVVILTRGGGSLEDLWEFNDEGLARTIARLDVPVISAVGHQTDYTISDFVADLRAPTPSAAAELVVARKTELAARLQRATGRLGAAARTGIERRRALVEGVRHRPGLASFPTRLALHGRRVDELTRRLVERASADIGRLERRRAALRLRLEALDVGPRLARIRTRVTVARERLTRAAGDGDATRRRRLGIDDERLAQVMRNRQAAARQQLETAAAKLGSLSPLGVLARGYAVCWHHDRTAIVRRSADVAVGDPVRVTLHEGTLRCEVTARDEEPAP
jgi:exodeoxyribonuclease VII large subunit